MFDFPCLQLNNLFSNFWDIKSPNQFEWNNCFNFNIWNSPTSFSFANQNSIFNNFNFAGNAFNNTFMNSNTSNNFHLSWSSSVYNNTLPSTNRTTATTQSSNISKKYPTYKIGNFDLNYWKSQGYNHEMGKKLALDAKQSCPGKADGGCVGYTRRTINKLYGTTFTNAGAAYQFGINILSHPSLKGKFKKVDMKSVAKAGIPDGAIVLWKPGAPGYTHGKAALYGHGGIAYQNLVYSDCIIRNLTTCCEVWIPV